MSASEEWSEIERSFQITQRSARQNVRLKRSITLSKTITDEAVNVLTWYEARAVP